MPLPRRQSLRLDPIRPDRATLPVWCRRFVLSVLVLAALFTGRRASAWPDPKRPSNRLAGETSPYLLLHAHNPVDWYPWGPEAFARAKAKGKPIFLSVGYSSCYWKHDSW
ncbi:MAG: hypothetical protein NVSMB9_11860 [Isosphaeraceae bacterium]